MIKIFALVAFLIPNPDTGKLEQKMYQKEMTSMEECEAFIHQEQFTQNVIKSIPGSEKAVGMFFDCIEATPLNEEVA